MIGILESRVLLSSSLKAGVLTVAGTYASESILISLVNGKLRVSQSGVASQDFVASQVSKIVVDAKAGNDKVSVASSVTKNAELRGGAGNDTLRGGGGTDALLGQDGDDNLEGGAKNDYLDGGKGIDRIDYSALTTAVMAKLEYEGTPSTTGAGGAAGESDKYASIESISGTSKNDALTFVAHGDSGSSTAEIYKLDGLGGNDHLDIAAIHVSDALKAVAHGGEGNDVFDYNSDYQYVIYVYGDAGNDSFIQYTEDSTARAYVDGGSGHDSDHFHRMYADEGSSYKTPPGIEDAYVSLQGLNYVYGNDLDNKLYVDFGFSQSSSDGFAMVDGKGGNDYIEVSSWELSASDANDVPIRGGLGNDTIVGSDCADSIFGDGGNDVIYGGTGNDYVEGGAGKDTITGGSGKDKIYGGADNDFLKGKDSEKDTLDGGSGIDTAERDKTLDVLASIETPI